MATERFIKYNVVLINAIANDCEIIFTTMQLNDAKDKMTKYIDDNFPLDDVWTKCYHQNQKTCSIYKYFYLFKKQLINKIQILEYVDC